jgi:hypothetical protein
MRTEKFICRREGHTPEMKDRPMKKMIAALVLAAAVASPVMAETESGLSNSGYSTFNPDAYGAYASTAPAQVRNLKRTRTHVEMAPDMTVQPNTNDLIDR